MSKLKYYLIAGLLRIVSFLPLGTAQFIGNWAGLLAWKLGGRPQDYRHQSGDLSARTYEKGTPGTIPGFSGSHRHDSFGNSPDVGMARREVPWVDQGNRGSGTG